MYYYNIKLFSIPCVAGRQSEQQGAVKMRGPVKENMNILPHPLPPSLLIPQTPV